ncbi:MAG: AbrB/MazE/SpoVT family DNA-binding domain-containing protein [Candidatus Eremiobacteraeota bacterium]|nr:AbrB/MazE/SpoVT family DNA-binding domain-containing protein [Candidatus Eremiobacteraeota bacterium]MDQ7824071.1 AbrB/MazE/SpoVT family DNA-binding domain-containing protein [Candidatus Eremiobacteraeota bacterium]
MKDECMARMTSKGQITLPARIRKKINAGTGDYILFRVRGKIIELEKVDLSWEERFNALAGTIEERFKKEKISKKDIEEAIKWARESS